MIKVYYKMRRHEAYLKYSDQSRSLLVNLLLYFSVFNHSLFVGEKKQ